MTEELELLRRKLAVRGTDADVPARLSAAYKARGAVTCRVAKEIFSKPAALDLIDQVASHSDAVVQALAD